MYSQTILDEIRDRVSIAALVGERIPLKKAGRNFKGNCPFHSEKTPSFMVSDEKQIYHCFGCGEGGNVFNFFMKFDGLTFREAVEMLAARSGVQLPKLETVDKKADDEAERKKKWAFRLNKLVAEYFYNNMLDPKKGEAARNYLKSRDIIFEKITQHFLGYADDSWDGLVRYLESKKAPLDLAAEIGVIKKRESGGYYDFFRHRVVFPVITPALGAAAKPGSIGKVVAFSGRTFGEPKTAEGQEPPAKYLNSPDSPIYHKSYTVYGLNVGADAARRADQVILVEGNLDVMRLHQEGIENVVAPLGTALTSGHVKLLSRYTKNFVVIFDGDDAGYKAAVRALPLFLEAGFVPRVVALPKGEDPDSFVKNKGEEAMRGLVAKAGTLFEFVIDDTVRRFGTATDGKVRVVEELKPYFAMIRNSVEASQYRKRLASKLMLDESVISHSLAGKKQLTRESFVNVVQPNTIEKMLLELLLAYPETIGVARGRIDFEKFTDGSCQAIAKLIFDEFDKSGRVDVANLADGIDDAELKSEVLALALAENKYDDADGAMEKCIAAFDRMSAKRRLKELSFAIQQMASDDDRVSKCMAEIQKLNEEIHNLNKRENIDERTGT